MRWNYVSNFKQYKNVHSYHSLILNNNIDFKLGSNQSAEQKPRTSDMDNCAVSNSVKHNLLVISGKGPFEDLNFGFVTMRTSIVYGICGTHHLHKK